MTKVFDLLIQWEEDENGGVDHIFAKEQSQSDSLQAKEYLCGLTFIEEPDVNAVALEYLIGDPKVLRKSICLKCHQELNSKFPKIYILMERLGITFFFYTAEWNEAKHVYVFKSNPGDNHGKGKYWLEPMKCDFMNDFSSEEQNNIEKTISQEREYFIERWKSYFPQ